MFKDSGTLLALFLLVTLANALDDPYKAVSLRLEQTFKDEPVLRKRVFSLLDAEEAEYKGNKDLSPIWNTIVYIEKQEDLRDVMIAFIENEKEGTTKPFSGETTKREFVEQEEETDEASEDDPYVKTLAQIERIFEHDPMVYERAMTLLDEETREYNGDKEQSPLWTTIINISNLEDLKNVIVAVISDRDGVSTQALVLDSLVEIQQRKQDMEHADLISILDLLDLHRRGITVVIVGLATIARSNALIQIERTTYAGFYEMMRSQDFKPLIASESHWLWGWLSTHAHSSATRAIFLYELGRSLYLLLQGNVNEYRVASNIMETVATTIGARLGAYVGGAVGAVVIGPGGALMGGTIGGLFGGWHASLFAKRMFAVIFNLAPTAGLDIAYELIGVSPSASDVEVREGVKKALRLANKIAPSPAAAQEAFVQLRAAIALLQEQRPGLKLA